MPGPKNLHRMTNGEWYARALRERAATAPTTTLGAFNTGAEVRVVFVLEGLRGPLDKIVENFVTRVWPEYDVTEYCLTRHGSIVTVEERP